jgi:hypothetical protein
MALSFLFNLYKLIFHLKYMNLVQKLVILLFEYNKMNTSCWTRYSSSIPGKTYYKNRESGITQWGIPDETLPAGWEKHWSKSKNRFFL